MHCRNCGAELIEGSAFCIKCGQKIGNKEVQIPKQKQQTVHKKANKTAWAWIFAAISVLLAAALVVVLLMPGIKPETKGSIGFDTPEEAIEYFIDCINNEDIEGALSVSYAEKAVQNYDFEAMAERIASVQFNMMMPSEYEFYRVLNETQIKSQLLNQIRGLVLSLTKPEYASVVLEGQPYILKDEKADYEGLDPTLKNEIEIVEIDVPIPDLYHSDTNQKVMKTQRRVYGADSFEWRAVLYEYDGDYYVGGFQLFEYNEKFYIYSAQENLIAQSAFGALIPIDNKSDFDEYID